MKVFSKIQIVIITLIAYTRLDENGGGGETLSASTFSSALQRHPIDGCETFR